MRRQLQDKERQLTSGQAAVRDTETRLQELRSKIAGYEDTQQAYQARFCVLCRGPSEPCMLQLASTIRICSDTPEPGTLQHGCQTCISCFDTCTAAS